LVKAVDLKGVSSLQCASTTDHPLSAALVGSIYQVSEDGLILAASRPMGNHPAANVAHLFFFFFFSLLGFIVRLAKR